MASVVAEGGIAARVVVAGGVAAGGVKTEIAADAIGCVLTDGAKDSLVCRGSSSILVFLGGCVEAELFFRFFIGGYMLLDEYGAVETDCRR